MSVQIATLADASMRDLPTNPQRRPDPARVKKLLASGSIISADGHWEISDDIFYERLPAHLKDKAPRIWFDEWWHMGDPKAFKKAASPRYVQLMKGLYTEGFCNLEFRKAQLHADGVEKEICFPQNVLFYFGSPDLELKEAVFRVYNEHVAERQRKYPGVFYGVGICANWWDADRFKASIDQIKSLGLKTFLLPNNPGKYRDGRLITYGDPELEPLWSLVEEAGLPACFHIGENVDFSTVESPGGFYWNSLTLMAPFRKPFGQLTFGGVFDRHPNLRIVFVESGISWVPAALQDAEMFYDTYAGIAEERPKHRPSHYWFNNCYATFMNDRLGLKNIEYVGADRIMWSSDYPHAEGTFGFTAKSLEAVLEAVPLEQAKEIVGGTARKLFKLDP